MGLWIAALAIIAAIAVTIRLTRPPSLVWWTSPRVGDSSYRLRILAPPGWELHSPVWVEPSPVRKHSPWHAVFQLVPRDRMPKFLRWIFRRSPEEGEVWIEVYQTTGEVPRWGLQERGIECRDNRVDHHQAYSVRLFREPKIWASVVYRRTDLHAFDETFVSICNSLRIE